jgi:hypothetical protein
MKAKQILTKQTLHNLFERVQGGSFVVKYKNGETQHYGEDEPQFKIRFNDDNILDLVSAPVPSI